MPTSSREDFVNGLLGLDACVVVGDATNAALRGTLTVDAALAAMQTGLDALVAQA